MRITLDNVMNIEPDDYGLIIAYNQLREPKFYINYSCVEEQWQALNTLTDEDRICNPESSLENILNRFPEYVFTLIEFKI